MLRTRSASLSAKPWVTSDVSSSADTSVSGSPMTGSLTLDPAMRASGSLASSVGASCHAAAAAAVVSNTSSYSSVAASDGNNHWAAAAGLAFLPTVAARLQSGLLADSGAELPHTPIPPEEAPAANPAADRQQAAPAEVSEQPQQKLDNGFQGQIASAGDGEGSSGQPSVAPSPEPGSAQELSSPPSPSAKPASPAGGGVEPPAPGAAPATATASRRSSSRSFRQHRAMRALRAQSGGSSGSGGASSGGPNSRSSSRPMSRSTSRAASLREPPPAAAAAGPQSAASSAQRLVARSIEQSLDPLLRARVEELAEQAVAARLRRRLSSGDSMSPVLTDEEILAADVAGIFRSSGDGGSGLESQR